MKATRTKRTNSAQNATLALAAVCLFGMLASNTTDAAIIDIKYEFTSGAASATVTGAGAGNVSAADATLGNGLSGSGNAGFSSGTDSTYATSDATVNSDNTSTPESDAVSANDYFEFQVTVDPGLQVNISQLSFVAGGSVNTRILGDTEINSTFFVRSDAETSDFSATLLSDTHDDPDGVFKNDANFYVDFNDAVSVDLSTNPDFQGLTGTVTFRQYVYTTAAAANSYWARSDDFQIIGEVIPEPSTALLLALGGLAALLRRRPRRA